jgi:hypothetical protein
LDQLRLSIWLLLVAVALAQTSQVVAVAEELEQLQD